MSQYSTPNKTAPNLTPLQKAMTNPRSHKPFKRFKDSMVANSGMNPHGGFMEFTKKDPINNIDIHRDNRPPPPDISHLSSKWAVGTQKATFQKVDSSGVLDRSQYETKSFPRNPTDNISFDPPANDRPFQKVYDEMITKPKYDINVPTSQPWVPPVHGGKTINNRSSVPHNIISHEPNQHSSALVLGLLDKKVTNMKKGIGEYKDLNRITAINSNKDHINAFNENPHIFKRKVGVFTHLYDAAHRFGEDKPFKH